MSTAIVGTLTKVGILDASKHPGCLLYESPGDRIVVLYNSNVFDLLTQIEEMAKLPLFKMVGGVQLIPGGYKGGFGASATFFVEQNK